jgi:hypothetical protein
MTIDFKPSAPTQAQRGNISLNESRVDRILNAKTLGEAQRMGVFDRMSDWFRGGVKAEAIRQIYDQITSPAAHEAQACAMLQRFEKLRALATDEHQTAFNVQHHEGLGPQSNQWAYSFELGGTEVFHSGPLDDASGHSSKDFKNQMGLFQGVRDTVRQLKTGLSEELKQQLYDVNAFVRARISTMTDDEGLQKKLAQQLDDPVFSKRNFRHMVEVEPGKSFQAVFQLPGQEGTVSLDLSDRRASADEFRSHTLRQALQGGTYANLRELLSQGHLGRTDNQLRYCMSAATGGMHTAISHAMGELSPSSREMFAFVRDQQPVNNPWLEQLRQEKIGDMSLLDACFPDAWEEADQLQAFDKARTRLEAALPALSQRAAEAGANIPRRTLDQYVQENAQDMVDDAGERAALLARLDDPIFSAANFKGIMPGETDASFKAVFQLEGQAPQELVLSNRAAAAEFRSDKLKAVLLARNYNNLRDVLATGYLGAKDPMVGATANRYVSAFLTNELGLGDTAVLTAFLQHLKQHGPKDLALQTFNAMRLATIANTNVLELLMGDGAPPVPLSALTIAPSQLA